MIFELVNDYADALAAIPAEHPRRRMLELLEEAVRRDVHFIARHPTTLFQCLWNTCWWYDCPEAAAHHVEPEGGWPDPPPWERQGEKLCARLEAWRRQKEDRTPGFRWLCSCRPPSAALGSALKAVLRGHTCPVQCVAFAPDGQRLASCSAHLAPGFTPAVQTWHNRKRVPVEPPAKHPYPTMDNSIRVWDPATGHELAVIEFGDGPVRCCEFSPDGQSLACSGSQQGTVRIVGADDGASRLCFHGHDARVNRTAFSPDGEWIASASGDGTIRVREARTGADRWCLRGHESPVMCVAFSPDGRLLASGSVSHMVPGDNSIRVWSLATGSQIACASFPDLAGIPSVAFAPDGRSVAAACFDHRVVLFGIADGTLHERTLGTHDGEVLAVAFDPDGRRVVSGSTDKTVRVWDVSGGTELACLRGHLDIVNSVAFSPDGRFIASGSADCTVRIWDTARRAVDVRLHDHRRDIVDLAFAGAGSRVVSASQDGTVRVWNGAGRPLQVRPDSKQVRKLIACGDGRRAFTADYYEVRIHDLASTAVLPVGPGDPNAAASEPSTPTPGPAGLAAGTVQTHTTPEGETIGVYRCKDVEITDFTATADGELVVAGCWNGDLRIWRACDGTEVERLSGPEDKPESLAFSPSADRMIYAQEVTCLDVSRDGKRIVSGSADGTVRFWDIAALAGTGNRCHRSAVRSIAFSPDCASVASGAADGELAVWRISQGGASPGGAFQRFRAGTSAVDQLAFSPNGQWLIAASTDRTLRVNLVTGQSARLPGRCDAPGVAADTSWLSYQAVVCPLETAFVIPLTGDVAGWYPAPLACLRTQPGGGLWAGAEVSHLCLLVVRGAR